MEPEATTNTLDVDHRTSQSAFSWLGQILLRALAPLLTRPPKTLPPGSPHLTVPSALKKQGISVCERQVEEVFIYDIETKPADGSIIKRQRIYCIAGGSFRTPPTSDHWKFYVHLAFHLPNATISVISPPLSPNSPAPKTVPQSICMSKKLLQDAEVAGEEVTFLGDSSGGNLMLSLALTLAQHEDMPCPAHLMLICPSVDLRHINPVIPRIERLDPLLKREDELKTSKDWAGEWGLEHPAVSPLLGDLGLLSKRGVAVSGVTAGHDMLTSDALVLRRRLSSLGIRGRWLEWDKQFHCFPLAFSYRLPESVKAVEWIIEGLRSTNQKQDS